MLADLAPGSAGSKIEGMTSAGGRLLFAADNGEHGLGLWSSDGTVEGTHVLLDAAPGLASSSPRDLTAAGGNLFWTADAGDHGHKPWVMGLSDLADPPR